MKIFVQKKVGDGKLIFTFVTVLKRKIVLTRLNHSPDFIPSFIILLITDFHKNIIRFNFSRSTSLAILWTNYLISFFSIKKKFSFVSTLTIFPDNIKSISTLIDPSQGCETQISTLSHSLLGCEARFSTLIHLLQGCATLISMLIHLLQGYKPRISTLIYTKVKYINT